MNAAHRQGFRRCSSFATYSMLKFLQVRRVSPSPTSQIASTSNGRRTEVDADANSRGGMGVPPAIVASPLSGGIGADF